MTEDIKTGTFVFRPRARLIKTIGEELISDDKVAIIELVKNSYDAYCTLQNAAPIVDIIFKGDVKTYDDGELYIDKKSASITVYDEGIGMDFDIIQHAWMEPATNFKKLQRNQNPSKKYTGEKGIGRFAAAKLAAKLELVTKQKDKDEIVVRFDWSDFSNESDYLEDISIDWIVRPPQEIQSHGTILKLVDLNEDWDKAKIKDLRIALSRLLNPIVPSEDFLINLILPESMELSGLIERPETLNNPNYSIKGRISDSGRPENVVFYSRAKSVYEALHLNNNGFGLKDYTAGAFSFEFKIWNRENAELKTLANEMGSLVKNVKEDLDELCGISIYRDNIRVLPYGNKNNDWVRLDMRRVNNPTLRLSNNQIVGYISIGIESNPLLKDQSNREGIVESQAFEEIKEYVKLILNEVEQRRYKERPREEGPKKSSSSLFEAFSLRSVVAAIQKENLTPREILGLINEREAEIKDSWDKVLEIISRYRRLSTLGLLIDPILHDGRNYLNKIDLKSTYIINEAKKGNGSFNKIAEKAYDIQFVRKDFVQLFARLEPFGGRRRGRPKRIIVEDTLNNIFLLNQEELINLNIEYSISETQHNVTINESELGQIFINLIQNAIYWLGTIDWPRKISVEIVDERDGLAIFFSDNGPGINPEIADEIFNPYFSTKPDGVGLGLAIIGEIMADYNGEFVLVESILGGASFKLKFKYRV